MTLNRLLRYLPDGRVLVRDGKRAWYIKTRRFVVPIPRGVVWHKSKAHERALFD